MPIIRNLDGNIFADTTTEYDNIASKAGPVEARRSDLLRLTERLVSPVGATFTAKQALLRTSPALTKLASAQINGASPSEKADLRVQALIASAEAASHIATILAQVPVNGTGTHFLYNEILRLASLDKQLYYTGNSNAANEALYKGTITVKARNGSALDADLGFAGAQRADDIGMLGIGESTALAIKQDLLPVVFSIVGEPNSTLVFRGYIQGLTNGYSPQWTPVNYVGRGEPLYTYTNTTRTLGFTLQIPIFSKEEQHPSYQKVNSLISHTYPKYVNNIPQGTITRVRIGDYLSQYGVINSITDVVETDVQWSSNEDDSVPVLLPQVIRLQISMNIIHNKLPQRYTGSETDFNILPFTANGLPSNKEA